MNVMSFVDKGQLEPGSTVLLHNKVLSVVGLLADEADPMVSVMKVTAPAATLSREDLLALLPPHLAQSHPASPPCEDAHTASRNALPHHPFARGCSCIAVTALLLKVTWRPLPLHMPTQHLEILCLGAATKTVDTLQTPAPKSSDHSMQGHWLRMQSQPHWTQLPGCDCSALIRSVTRDYGHAVSVARQVEKAPTESYADVGGLEAQIQEIKEAVELPLTHPELYEDIGIKPPKVLLLPATAPNPTVSWRLAGVGAGNVVCVLVCWHGSVCSDALVGVGTLHGWRPAGLLWSGGLVLTPCRV